MNWFKQLAPHERRTLMIGTIALSSLLFYFLIWEPFVTARTQLEISSPLKINFAVDELKLRLKFSNYSTVLKPHRLKNRCNLY
ncbi:hypothetical protein BGP_4576 [Beggiatoa sp. PS]|nr:hypothetical protein BGP_4576 [Beggiatoa sp. PS]